MNSSYLHSEEVIRHLVLWLRLAVETLGATVIAVGIVAGAMTLVTGWLRRRDNAFTDARLVLARYLAMALEFQLAADILSTAIAPSWEQIGKLAAIAVIRTGLNFFLTREMETEGRRVRHMEPAVRAA